MGWPTKATAPPGTDTTSTAGVGGVFQRLGDFVVRWPWVVIGLLDRARHGPAAVVPVAGRGDSETADVPPAGQRPGDCREPNKWQRRSPNRARRTTCSWCCSTNDKGLGPADEQVYRTLVDRLRQDTSKTS